MPDPVPPPLFSLCYTTARSQAVESTVKVWWERAANPEKVEFIVCYDSGDTATEKAISAILISTQHGALTVAQNPGPKNCVSGWNTAAHHARGDILIAVADDFNPPKNWDKALIEINPWGWWTDERVVWVRDGYSPDLLTLSILTKKRYNKFGYIFYPGYQSLFCDTEFTYVASQDRVIIDGRNLLFEHMHPDCGKRPRDDVDLTHASSERWKFGETLFNYRKTLGFPLDDGPKAAEYSSKPVRYAVVVQAIRDDLCLMEVCQRLLEEGIRLRQSTELGDRIDRLIFFVPDMQWDGAPADIAGGRQVALIAKQLEQWLDYKYPGAGILVEFLPFHVKAVADITKERIQIETDCRNWYQRYCQSKGYEHCIIMDSDEFWKRGLLARMNDMVRERWPATIFTGMIPVAGLPAYPIEGARDKATIYARTDATFQMCRGAYGYRHELYGFDIFHFSAVRRTLKEIADKHLGSGHADDKDYAMADWVKDTLMAGRIVPGARDVHMFRKAGAPNVWPRVRNWKQEELDELPPSLIQYLGRYA